MRAFATNPGRVASDLCRPRVAPQCVIYIWLKPVSASVLARRRPSGRDAANSPLSSQSLQGLHKASLGWKTNAPVPFGLVWFLRYTNFPRRYLALCPHRLLVIKAFGSRFARQPLGSQSLAANGEHTRRLTRGEGLGFAVTQRSALPIEGATHPTQGILTMNAWLELVFARAVAHPRRPENQPRLLAQS